MKIENVSSLLYLKCNADSETVHVFLYLYFLTSILWKFI